jgi:hypothetical protein
MSNQEYEIEIEKNRKERKNEIVLDTSNMPLGERLVWLFQNDARSLSIAFEIPSRMTRSISTKSLFSRSFNMGKLMIKQNFNE